MENDKICKCGKKASNKWLDQYICEKCYSDLCSEGNDRTRPAPSISSNENRKNELSDCPFCNVEAHMLIDHISPYAVAYTPECMNPKCCATMGRFCTEKEATQAWNTRKGVNNGE